MATEIYVERKRKKDYLPWVLLALGLIVIAIVIATYDNKKIIATTGEPKTTHEAVTSPEPTGIGAAPSANKDWKDVNRNAPDLRYDEVKDKNIRVRGTNDYAVYDLGEDVLFKSGKSDLSAAAIANLRHVASSIKQRFDKGEIRLYGFTDEQGDKSFNKKLARDRAEAVKKWLIEKGNIEEKRISIEVEGEAKPKESNDTEQGRIQNRRVQIVVRK